MNSKSSIKTIGVLTGGGDCPGINAVIRAVVKTAIYKYGLKVVGIQDGYKGMVENNTVNLTIDDVSGILPRGGTILGTTNRDNPFKYTVEIEGDNHIEDRSDQAIQNMKNLGIDGMVIIGGDGTLTIGNMLSQKGLPVVGVPKTIDNDLSATDYTFGFDTAVQTATDALDKLHTTAESHHRIMILEVMGRYAGWIALHAGIGGGADVILIPEMPYTIENVVKKIQKRLEEGKRFSIIVVAEGAKPQGGEMVIKEMADDPTHPVRLGGVGHKIAKDISCSTGLETRVTTLGHLQRGGTPSSMDRTLSTCFGSKAVDILMERKFGYMVCLRTPHIKETPILEAVGKLKTVPIDSDKILAGKAIGISFGDE